MGEDPPALSEALQSYFAARVEELTNMRLSIVNETSKTEEQLAELKARLSAVSKHFI